MFRGKRATPQQIAHHQEQREEDEEEQMGSEYSGEEDEMGDEQQQAFVTDETVDGELAEVGVAKHVDESLFANRQTIDLDIDFVGSPEEFTAGTASTVWSPAAQVMKHFKVNTATINRHLADEKDLKGNLKRAVVFQVEVLQQKNTLPFAVGLVNSEMLPKNVHRHGAVLHRIVPTQLMTVGQKVFEPTNIIDKEQMDSARINRPEDVEASITVYPASKSGKAYATVAKNTMAYKTLLHNLGLGKWQEEKLTRAQLASIIEPAADVRRVQVTEKMGTQLKKTLMDKAHADIARMVDLEKLEFRLVRADGYSEFSNASALEGELVGSVLMSDGIDGVKSTVSSNPLLLKRGAVHAKIRLTFGTLE